MTVSRIGRMIAKANALKKPIHPKPRKPVVRTIDISEYADTLLHFWASKVASGASYRELGHAYGMNGWQMRSAVAQWKQRNFLNKGRINT